MASRSTNRAIVRSLDKILEAHKSIDNTRILSAISTLDEMMNDRDCDSRTRFNAAHTLLKHSWDVYTHENPCVEKSEVLHKGLPVPPSELTIRVINAPDKRKV